MSEAPACDHGCRTRDDCQGTFGCAPPWLEAMDGGELAELLDFANRVQAWAWARPGPVTFRAAAAALQVTVERINQAVIAHYWMFTPDTDRPLDERRIDHEGE